MVEYIYKENDRSLEGDLGLQGFKENYFYEVLDWDKENELKTIYFTAEIGKDNDITSLAYLKIKFKLFLKQKEFKDHIGLDELSILINYYIYPRLKTMIASITDQSKMLMPYFIKPIFKIRQI